MATTKVMETKLDTISITMPRFLVKALDSIAGSQDRSRSAMLRRIVAEYIEDYKDLQTGLKALKEHKKNGSKAYSMEEVMTRLGITKEDIDPKNFDFSDCD